MITFTDARHAVYALLVPGWPSEGGNLITLANGFEDDTHYQVIAGAKEALVGGDFDFVVLDMPAFMVDKETGAVEMIRVLDNFERLDAMQSVGV